MAESKTRSHTQHSVFLPKKPGILARVCQQLADEKINIIAISLMDAPDHGVLRLLAENPEYVAPALKPLDVSVSQSPVLLASMPNRPGALADMVERLSSARIAVSYAYVTTGVRNGQTLGVFSVSNANKAMQVLEDRKPKRKLAATARTSPRPRK